MGDTKVIKKYQTIWLHLSDGRTISATVPEFCKKGDKLYVHPQFEVTEPRDMPPDSYWSTLTEEIATLDVGPEEAGTG